MRHMTNLDYGFFNQVLCLLFITIVMQIKDLRFMLCAGLNRLNLSLNLCYVDFYKNNSFSKGKEATSCR